MTGRCGILALLAVLLFSCGCSTRSGPPLSYMALERPEAILATQEQEPLEAEFSRGGWYFFNYNFRPAADIESYLRDAHERAGATILRNGDVVLNVPFAFDILLFGYNMETDMVTAGQPAEDE